MSRGSEPAATPVIDGRFKTSLRTSLRTWLGFVLMCVGMFMAILDIQVVATSLPAIQQALQISPDAMSWIQTAYLIAEIIAIPLTGLLTRVFSLRWLFAGSVSLFTVASIGCAVSGHFAVLLVFRAIQGFSGGMLIPAVFSAVFLLFPQRLHAVATTIAGVVAVLAPTIGPVVGGFITDTWSWPWLFLINVVPGLVAALATPRLLPRQPINLPELSKLDLRALALLAAALASLEIGLKDAPQRGWLSPTCIALFALSASCTVLLIQRSLLSAHPILRLDSLRRRTFAAGCALSFCLGVGLFGAVYLMPVFLAFVRNHGAFEIGTVMLVTGVAQLIAAPCVMLLESQVDARVLTAVGFALFAAGLTMSAFEPRTADFAEMFAPQVVRGIAIMFCLLPPTRIALGDLPAAEVADASGLFNLMRNLGGAIGIALIDTIIYGRVGIHAADFRDRLLAGDVSAAKAIGLRPDLLLHRPPGAPDDAVIAYVQPLVEKASLALCVNEAWMLLGGVALLGLVLVLFTRDRAVGSEAPEFTLERRHPAAGRVDQLGPRSRQPLVHVDHEGHAEHRRRQVYDRD
jgi:MFS transporter, DHA2 family, multidrug resistance protein